MVLNVLNKMKTQIYAAPAVKELNIYSAFTYSWTSEHLFCFDVDVPSYLGKRLELDILPLLTFLLSVYRSRD